MMKRENAFISIWRSTSKHKYFDNIENIYEQSKESLEKIKNCYSQVKSLKPLRSLSNEAHSVSKALASTWDNTWVFSITVFSSFKWVSSSWCCESCASLFKSIHWVDKVLTPTVLVISSTPPYACLQNKQPQV